MQQLVAGIHKFQSGQFAQDRELFQTLAKGQSPGTLFITCSDSRIDPNLLTQTKPGQLFILRTAGNIVPPYGSVMGGEAATIEYAMLALKVTDIVVCGHSHCGAMGGLLALDSLAELPAVRAYLQHAEATRRIIADNYSKVTDKDKRLSLTVEENVLVQLENLRTHPTVASALARKSVRLHGWVYKFENGEVDAFDPVESQFRTIGDTTPDGIEGPRNQPQL